MTWLLRVSGAFPARTRLASMAVALAAGTMLAGAPAAMAAVPAAGVGAIYSTSSTGYQATGRWFRYAQTQIVFPTNFICSYLHSVLETSAGPGSVSVTVGLGSSPAAHIAVVISSVPTASGCGIFTGQLEYNATQNPMAVGNIDPGDTVRVSVYYNPGTYAVSAAVVDLTDGLNVTAGADSSSGSVFTSARIETGFSAFHQPGTGGSSVRAFSYTGSAATTATGDRGTMTGPWTTSQVIMTANGKASDPVEANGPVLWDNGANFSTWIRDNS